MRINGIGIAWLGVEPRLPDGSFWATTWFTFLFLPIFPLGRRRLKVVEEGQDLVIQELEDSRLSWASILKTLGFSWLMVPFLVGAPMPLLVTEVWIDMLGWSQTGQNWGIGLWIVWLGVWVLGLSSWHEKRFQP